MPLYISHKNIRAINSQYKELRKESKCVSARQTCKKIYVAEMEEKNECFHVAFPRDSDN